MFCRKTHDPASTSFTVFTRVNVQTAPWTEHFVLCGAFQQLLLLAGCQLRHTATSWIRHVKFST